MKKLKRKLLGRFGIGHSPSAHTAMYFECGACSKKQNKERIDRWRDMAKNWGTP